MKKYKLLVKKIDDNYLAVKWAEWPDEPDGKTVLNAGGTDIVTHGSPVGIHSGILVAPSGNMSFMGGSQPFIVNARLLDWLKARVAQANGTEVTEDGWEVVD